MRCDVTLHGLGRVMLTKQTKDYSKIQICAYKGANLAYSGIGNGNNKNIVKFSEVLPLSVFLPLSVTA